MALFSAIDCAQEGDITENLNAITGRITAVVTLSCAWEDRLDLADDILLNRREYPLITTSFTPIAISCSIVSKQGGFQCVTDGQHRPPEKALVTVNYGVSDTQATDAFDVVSESLDPVAEFTRLNHSQFRFGSQAGLPLLAEEAPGLLVIKLRLTRRIYRLSSMPAEALTSFGGVNNQAYISPILGFTFDEETLLYDAPQPETTIDSEGNQGFNLTQNFVYNPNGWNRYFNPITQTWDYIYHISSPLPFRSYPLVDMTGML